MLKQLRIHNYRSFVNFEWVPPRSGVLVGENGAGKTSVLDALWLLRELVVEGKMATDAGWPGTRTTWTPEGPQTIEVHWEHDAERFHYRVDLQSSGRHGELREELRSGDELLYRAEGGKVDLFGDAPTAQPRTTIDYHKTRSFLAALQARQDNRRVTRFRALLENTWFIRPDPPRIGDLAEGEAHWLEPDLSNFAAWYLAKSPSDFGATEKLHRRLRETIAGFAELRLEPVSSEAKELRVKFAFGVSGSSDGSIGHELRWRQLSDGQRLLIALYGVLHLGLPTANLILLDEVENYVAPSEIQPWLSAVTDLAADQNQQVLVVSHHPEAINYLAADSVWRMWRDRAEGFSRISPMEIDLDAGVTAYDVLKLGAEDAGPNPV